jgi:hypothetical protein
MSLEREEEWTRTAASLKIELGLNEFDDDKVHSFFFVVVVARNDEVLSVGSYSMQCTTICMHGIVKKISPPWV